MTNSIKFFILKSLIILYVLFSFSNATHIHDDNEEHIEDCQICVIIKAFSDIDTPKYSLNTDCAICRYLIETVAPLTIEISCLKGFFSHAPPFSLFS